MAGIYVVGAHSVGKTTLVRWIARHYKLKIINEVARNLLAERETTLETIRLDIDEIGRYQTQVLIRQLAAEEAFKGSGHYVSDRAFDSLAYTAEHTFEVAKSISSPEFQRYVKRVKEGLVFFVRPHRRIMKDDATLREKVDWEAIVRIDGMVKMLLAMSDVNYVILDSPLHQERIMTVRLVVDLFFDKQKLIVQSYGDEK